ncbi:MAG: hypothetical protein OQK32_05560 [Gammaproteobacteria bacterium]|nr:hypothetical protein [Gammaproteobacteria bacterium]MCW8922398.1 hypothetical protein [Gammaproteobacteria bacterium]
MKNEKPPHQGLRATLTWLRLWERILRHWRVIFRHLVSITASVIVLIVIITQGDGDAITYLREDAVTVFVSYISAKIKNLI